MSEQPVRLTAADLRARLAGVRPEPTPDAPSAPAPAPVVSGATPGFRKGVQASEQSAPAPVRSAGRRVNQYGGKCVTCAIWVEATAGYLAKTAEGKWAAEHIGECPVASDQSTDLVEQAVAAQDAPVPPGFVKITAITGQTYVGLQPGIYTLETDRGHRTFRVRVQSTEDDFAPGKTILEYLSGSDNERDYTGFGFLNGAKVAIWAKHRENAALVADAQQFLADPSKALLSARCVRCNKRLSTPESIERMLGPDCLSKGW